VANKIKCPFNHSVRYGKFCRARTSEVDSANYGGAWNYDTFVPIIFAGCGLNPVEVYRRVETVDIARTLAAWMGIKPPSGCVGKVLVEVF